jgi:[acyl-carrier-protein] S-malonyltransferase
MRSSQKVLSFESQNCYRIFKTLSRKDICIMGKVAFLYPGQGSQKVGMGSALLKTNPDLFEKYLAPSDTIANLPITQYCLEGPIETLSQTNVAQPALFTYSLALTDYARRIGFSPDLVAGHSLGEYTATVAAGVLSFAEGLSLVCQRGKLMFQLQNENPGAMAAVIGIPEKLLLDLCASISTHHFVMVSAWNTPTQFVVSGMEAGIEELSETLRSHKGARAIRLATRGAFHTPLMEPARSALSVIMQDMSWHDAHIPLVANVSGNILTKNHLIRQELCEQITNPIRWVQCVQTLVAAGCDTFVELGSSQVLTNLIRAIAPETQFFAADTPEKIVSIAQTLKAHVYA